ncbi:MAG: DUF569 domain-containing protein [Spirochaetaceae bacterium]|jgi:hypothetical protein|nr:DUF569 domain-containing protein [Spirochaetaceae bacterium]
MSDEQNSNFTGSFKQFLEKLQSGEISGSWSVSLESYKGKYLSASTEGDAKWDQDQAGENEWFKIEPKGDYKIALKSRHLMYLSAKADKDRTVRCDEHEAGASEIWTVDDTGDSGITLKSCLGKYLRQKKEGEVAAKHNDVTDKETFTVAWKNKEEK